MHKHKNSRRDNPIGSFFIIEDIFIHTDNPLQNHRDKQLYINRNFYSDLYFKIILGYTTPSVQANWTKSVKLRKKPALCRKKSGMKRT